MIESLGRIVLSTVVAVPLVAAAAGLLTLVPQAASLVTAIVGIALLMCAETFRFKAAMAAGGMLAMSGLLAWALMSVAA